MKKNIFLVTTLLVGSVITNHLWAQNLFPKERKTEEIIIRKNSDKDKKMTIQVDGDSITVNGKPLSDFHDGEVTVMKRDFMNGRSDNFLYTPDNRSMDFDVFKNNDENGAPHTFLGVLTDKSNNGVKINEVVKGSAAEKSGLMKGDIITKLGDKEISSPEDLMGAVKSYKAGDEVKVYYTRDNKKKDVKVKLGETKGKKISIYKNFEPGMGSNDLNFKMPPMPNMNNRFFNFRYNENKPKLGLKIEDTENNNGVKILNVEEGSPADKAGLKKDDIITSMDNEKVSSVDEIMNNLNDSENKESLNIKAMRNNSEMNFEVKIAKKLNTADL